MTEHYDDQTLEKVRRALFTIFGGNIQQQRYTDAIAEMQNAGILFRERGEHGTARRSLGNYAIRELLVELRTRAELNAGKRASGYLADWVDDAYDNIPAENLDARREWPK